jgi:hypothetical protein
LRHHLGGFAIDPRESPLSTRDTTKTPSIPSNAFLTPAGQIDFPDNQTSQDALNALWNTNLSGFTAQGITGNPWTTTNSANQTWYFDPTTTDTRGAVYAVIQWSPLPGRITYYFPQLANTPDLFSLADTGYDTKGQTFGQITNNPCDPSAGTNTPYGPYGPRGWQDEYCEWSIVRNSNNKLVRIDYTCENPEYFNSVWLIDPAKVLEIYRQTLSKPQIALEDLYLRDAGGKVVIDPSTGRPAYNPLNKWNRGSLSDDTQGGAMHLTSTPNTIQTEIGLGSTATTPRPCGNANPQTLICCAQYGQIGRNSDPNIGAQVNAIVNTMQGVAPAKATLANPPGLYIQTPDFSRFTTPDGTPASTFWKVTRGTTTPLVDAHGTSLPGEFILHATFSVPPEYGYTVSDILIDGTPIMYASQINQTFLMHIVGQALRNQPVAPPQPCPTTPVTTLAQPLQLFHAAVFDAMYATTYPTVVGVTATLASNSTLIAPWVPAGASDVPMVVVLGEINPAQPPRISFGDPAIEVVAGEIKEVTYAIPGNSYPSQNYAMAIKISVSASAAPGLRGCYATNPAQPQAPPMPALLNIVAAKSSVAG